MQQLLTWLKAGVTDFLRFCRRHLIGVVALAVAVALAIFLEWQGHSLHNPTAQQGVVSLELARDADRAQAVISSWQGLENRAWWQVFWDLPFIAAYIVTLLYWGFVAAAAARARGLPWLAAATRWAAIGAAIAGLCDYAEDWGLFTMIGGSITDPIAARTSWFATTKFTLILAAIGLPILAAVARPMPPIPPPLTWNLLLRTTRPVVGVLAFTAIALLLPPQTQDMLASFSVHSPRGWWAAIAFHFGLAALSLGAWFWARALLAARFGSTETRALRAAIVGRYNGSAAALDWLPRLLFVAGAAIGIIAAARSHAWLQLLIIAGWAIPGILWLWLRLGEPGGAAGPVAPAAVGAPAAASHALVPGWLAGFPIGNATKVLIANAPIGPRLAFVLLAVAALAFVTGSIGTLFPEAIGLLRGVSYGFGYLFPGPAVVLIGLALMFGPLSLITAASDRVRLVGSAHGVPWSTHPPVFLVMLAIVLVVPSFIDLHAVRVVRAGSSDNRASLDDMFRNWAAKCPQGAAQPIIVAVSGGASRAGLWAARVLHDVDALAAEEKTGIFAVSSVSGGSLGAAAYAAAIAGQSPGGCTLTDENRARFRQAVVASLGDDALGPLLAGSLFGDIPRALLALPAHIVRRAYYVFVEGRPYEDWRGGDRAEALEVAFEHIWKDAVGKSPKDGAPRQFSQPFLTLAADKNGQGPTGPVWIANGTDAEHGVRILTTPFKVAPDGPFLGAVDALAVLGHDVPISTAIHNTARFPFLSPGGELSPVPPASAAIAPTLGQPGQGDVGPRQLIDGGYFENEGLLTAWELARHLEGLGAKPIIVEATADAEKDIPEDQIVRCERPAVAAKGKAGGVEPPKQSLAKSRPLQAAIPLLGLYSVRGGHSDWVLRQVRRQYCPSAEEAKAWRGFYHFYLYRLEEDVPLNWVLSPKMACQIWRAMTADIPHKGKASTPNPNLGERDALGTMKPAAGDQLDTCNGTAN